MPTTVKLRNKLLGKLRELFQLDKPDLDFGFYRIMHAKAKQVETFVGKDLFRIIDDAFGQVDEGRRAELQANIEKEIDAAKAYGVAEPENSPKVKEAKARYEALKDTATAEADVYDHLYRFFERYYDDGDFISRRYYTRENSGKAAPFAIPYNGEEVKLHWANADQYYIKTAEYFSNYTFDITQAAEIGKMSDEEKFLKGIPKTPLKIHFRIVEAGEGEHGNIKEADDKKRFFVLHEDKPVEVAAGANNDSPELVVNFEYKSLPGGKNVVDELTEEALKEKYGKGLNKGDMPNLALASKVINAVQELINHETNEKHEMFLNCLEMPSPTDKIPNRPLLVKYINQYTSRNTMDYFIHKDLGGFLKRELDFYIKNEVMHLDDIENADVPVVESYLAKLKVIRKIATKLIEFLAQLEDFQKKLWLKKKFVVETNYCITLDRVPEELYPEIAANDAQREEWVKLFAINEIEQNDGTIPEMKTPAYSDPITVDFLKANNMLVLDTVFFNESFKEKLIESVEDFDAHCDGILIHSENFHALNLLKQRYHDQVNSIYIDPPYNTDASAIMYKNNYKDSSWLSMMNENLYLSYSFLDNNGMTCAAIDDEEVGVLRMVLAQNYKKQLGVAVVRSNPVGRKTKGKFTPVHEYALFYGKETAVPLSLPKTEKALNRYLHEDENGRYTWLSFIRTGSNASRRDRPKLFYPIFVNGKDQLRIPKMKWEESSRSYIIKESPKFDEVMVYPTVIKNGKTNEVNWQRGHERFVNEIDEYRVRRDPDGIKIDFKARMDDDALPNTWWGDNLYASSNYGASKMKELFFDSPFDYPKALHLVIDCLKTSGMKRIDSLAMDFFAGSGTTGHAVIEMNREDNGNRRFILVEMGKHFDTVTKPRIIKVIYSSGWKDGKPINHNTGISNFIKYLRIESYEDTLNNLIFDENFIRNRTIESNKSLKEDYILHYLLNVETRGSQSLLNIDNFVDPASYTLKVKRPGSDEQVARNVDLIETFNYLIGLRLENMAAPQTFTASFTRKPDPELPEDQHTKLVVEGKIQPDENGKWWFRKIDGWVPADPMNPNNGQKEKVLIVWRKLTGNLEEDNLMLDEWFKKFRISALDFEYDTIYVNGSNNLPNLRKDDEYWKVRLIEEEFHKRMWETE